MTTPEITPKPAPNIAELKSSIQKAAAAGNFDELLSLTRQLDDVKKLVAKAEAEKLQTERSKRVEGMIAKLRTAFSSDIPLIKEFGPVLRLYIDSAPAAGGDPVFSAVFGSAASAPKSSGAGTATPKGKTQDMFGRSLESVFREFATPQELTDHDSMTAADNTKRWNLKQKVLKRAIEEGLIKPIS